MAQCVCAWTRAGAFEARELPLLSLPHLPRQEPSWLWEHGWKHGPPHVIRLLQRVAAC